MLKDMQCQCQKWPQTSEHHWELYIFCSIHVSSFLLQVLTCSVWVLRWLLSHQRPYEPLRAVEDAQMLYSVYNGWEQKRVSHPLSSETWLPSPGATKANPILAIRFHIYGSDELLLKATATPNRECSEQSSVNVQRTPMYLWSMSILDTIPPYASCKK